MMTMTMTTKMKGPGRKKKGQEDPQGRKGKEKTGRFQPVEIICVPSPMTSTTSQLYNTKKKYLILNLKCEI